MARRCPDDGRYGEPLVVNAPNFLAHCGMLLSSGTFYTLLVSYVMIEYVANMHEMTIVEYGVDKNVATLKQCNQLQTFNAVGQLTGRLVVPFLSDKLSFNRCAFTSAILALTAACFVLTAAANNYVTLALLTVAAGICEGYLICIRVVLAAEYLGVESIGLCFGFEGICMMPVAFSAPALIGFFRDKLGSYDRFYWMLGAMKLLPAFLVGGIAVADRLRKKSWNIDHGRKR
ncbi:monocarboxylate transporter 10-like [Dermacentor silvarum]|uniref:monocarboxylate transporter 10-like n=1 Tax=Dermacentor silvarum TaxID=543639 RepID=UPI002100E61E|nr:monocarboxylate transporter 10-like [Dermacentor silvarum]